MLSNLSQSKIKNEEDHNDEQDIPLINTTNRLKKQNIEILCKILKELARDPVKLTEKTLGKFNFNNLTTNYDYEEKVEDEDDNEDRNGRHVSRSRLRKNNSSIN